MNDIKDQLRTLGLRHTADILDDLVALATKNRWGAHQLFEHVFGATHLVEPVVHKRNATGFQLPRIGSGGRTFGRWRLATCHHNEFTLERAWLRNPQDAITRWLGVEAL